MSDTGGELQSSGRSVYIRHALVGERLPNQVKNYQISNDRKYHTYVTISNCDVEEDFSNDFDLLTCRTFQSSVITEAYRR